MNTHASAARSGALDPAGGAAHAAIAAQKGLTVPLSLSASSSSSLSSIFGMANEGTGSGLIFDTISGSTALLRTLQADPALANAGIVVTTDAINGVINIGNTTTGINVGAGQPVFAGKTVLAGIPTLTFNTLAAGMNITLAYSGDGASIVVSATTAPIGSNVWQYIADTGSVPSSVALNPAFPGPPAPVIPSNLVFPGTSSEASPPPFGGVTLIFDASSGAFRAGQVNGGQWVQASRGAQSAAFGQNTVASGPQSFAAGLGCSATGTACFAFGTGCSADGSACIAMGANTSVTGGASVGCVALGQESTASGNQCFAMGFQASANGQTNSVLGGVTNTVGPACSNSAILCGQNNTILAGHNSSSILSGTGITSTQDMTAFMQRFTFLGGMQGKQAVATIVTYSAGLDDWEIIGNTNANSVNIALPGALGNPAPLVPGQMYWFRHADNTNTMTITGVSGGGAQIYQLASSGLVNSFTIPAFAVAVLIYTTNGSPTGTACWVQIA